MRGNSYERQLPCFWVNLKAARDKFIVRVAAEPVNTPLPTLRVLAPFAVQNARTLLLPDEPPRTPGSAKGFTA